ncbi:hypothetical protein HBHAL_3410 [Halobacillus halophilus DSM 2266]|uniref:Uncharacterized protein n=1 Tax=Halobacillus halophilus (strain ATCC 35676 / DSM 2266 / JCM 20832 / KCTC 3685 / LMG 17431 / NBRC 102448 / NCIMB 2269) TaxID=866895 RepID=I0JNN4_HALH3|nr:hypothetical protein HBHAL_3410 [Halobacillus halophilus DSM 2266]
MLNLSLLVEMFPGNDSGMIFLMEYSLAAGEVDNLY